ncbi:hypothetical protein F0327_03305 [Citrobacter braakii]|nr:hypothetical protein F0327_03305 [Citrobacter braakii]
MSYSGINHRQMADSGGSYEPVAIHFDFEGIWQWKHTLSVFISTPEQINKGREKARQINHEVF